MKVVKRLKEILIWLILPLTFLYMWYGSILILLFGMQDLDKALEVFSNLSYQLFNASYWYSLLMSIIIFIKILVDIFTNPKNTIK